MHNDDLDIDYIIRLCYWLYPYAGKQYVDHLVYNIYRVFGSDYIRAFCADKPMFFNFIEDITSKFNGLELETAVRHAYANECKRVLTDKQVTVYTNCIN